MTQGNMGNIYRAQDIGNISRITVYKAAKRVKIHWLDLFSVGRDVFDQKISLSHTKHPAVLKNQYRVQNQTGSSRLLQSKKLQIRVIGAIIKKGT